MKYRSGFVSNSSSSSFIIDKPIGEAAVDMYRAYIASSVYYDNITNKQNKYHKKMLKRLKEYVRLHDVKNGTRGIVFCTCNENTFMIGEGDTTYVDTCSNHDWGEYVEYNIVADDLMEIRMDGIQFIVLHSGDIIIKSDYCCDHNLLNCEVCGYSYNTYLKDIDGVPRCPMDYSIIDPKK